MKTLFILLFLNLNLFASESTEISTHNSEVSKSIKDKQKESAFIDVSDVSDKAIEVITKTKSIHERIEAEKEKTKDIHEAVKSYADSISLLLKNPNYQDISSQKLRELQKMQSELAVYLIKLKEWQSVLKSSIDVYDKNSELLEKYSTLWSQTHTNAVDEHAPDAILEHIASVITHVEELKNTLKTQYDQTLTDSQIVSTNILTLEEMDSALQESEVSAKTEVFYQDKVPLFQLYSQNKFAFLAYLNSIKTTTIEQYNEVTVYFQVHADLFLTLFIVTLLSIAFIAYFNYLYRKKELFVSKESAYKKMFFFMGRPFSTFAILFILIIIAIFPDRPHALTDMMSIFLIIPVIRILQTIVKKECYKYIYIIFALLAMYLIEKNSTEYELESRIFMLLTSITLFIVVGAILIKKVLYTIHYNFVTRMGSYILVFSLLLLFVAAGSNLYGSVLLSTRLIYGVVTTIYASMIFYTLYTILTAYVVIVLRRRIATASNMLEKYSKNIENTTKLLIKIWMLSWWFLIVVRVVGVSPYLLTLKNDALALSWQVGQTIISIQSIFDFIFIIFATWFLARLIRTVLEVEVFARFTFPRGVPTAIITVLNYAIIITGTIIAFSSLGVSAQQFALIFGALGVGIGFGLRNIIANFVSGIIMVFERPVQIGDVIEVDKTMGEVQSIGSRASTLKTFDGSEVIIPNADFIAKEITNWTLSDKRRRKVVDFKVAFDSDIDLILKIMKEVALSHPDVLKDPEPLATFQGFGEYYLEFKLYFWLSQNLIVAPSDVSIGIYKTLKEAGVKMPVQKTQLERAKE
jgi:small-conductance mechanosensitive channel